MYKDNAVGNVAAETGKNLVSMITARLSDLSMPLKGEVRRSPVEDLQSARQPIARSGKFVRRASSRRALDCEKDDGLTCMYAFSHRDDGAHFWFCLRGGWGKSGDLTWHPAVKHQRPAAKTTNSNCCDRAAAQVKQHIPEQPGWKNSKCWANIEKRNQINTKNYWKQKRRLCVKLFEVRNTTWENLKIAKHKSVQYAEWMTLICALRFADFLRLCLSPRTTSRTISFSISNSF